MTRAIPWQAVDLCKRFEGYKAEAYLCPAGVYTCGYGHTLAVNKGVVCNRHTAEMWLKEDLTTAAKRIERLIGPKIVADLTDGQWGALLSFVFNLGANPSWTLWKLLKARDYDAIPAQLQRFCYGGGKKLAGLVKRRAAEIECWNTAEPGLSDDEVHSAVLRVTETPPAPVVAPKPAPLVAAVASCVTTCGVAAKAVTDAIQPFAEQSPWVGQAVAVLGTVGAVVAVLTVALVWLQHQKAKT